VLTPASSGGRVHRKSCDGACCRRATAALSQTFPTLRVLGIDIWNPALAIAVANVASFPARDRIEIRKEDACELRESKAFDLVWFPSPFFPELKASAAVERAHRALRSGGWIIFVISAASEEPLASSLNQLRTVRSGGHVWPERDAEALLRAQGFVDVRTLERSWPEPVVFVTGRTL